MPKPLFQTIPAKPKKRYPIIVEEDACGKLPDIVGNLVDVDTIVILYDVSLKNLAETIARSLPGSALIAVPTGEASKSLAQVERIAQDLLIKGATRKSLLINVGGGMLTDLGGFTASVFLRGIRFINVSTSLLGMADASIGGKTGVDLGNVKNMVGTIYHPEAVIIDTTVLETLPDEQLNEGLVEVVKMAAMLDREFFGWLEENMERVLRRDPEMMQTCIQNAVRMKVEVVEHDEQDNQKRLFLNFGHTVGHAVEALSRFCVSHGKAVSIGMMCEMRIAKTEDALRIAALMEALSMPLEIPQEMNANDLWDVMQQDKKVIGGKVRMSVPKCIGEGDLRPITKEDFLAAYHG